MEPERKRRLATIAVILAVGFGLFFLFRGAPVERTLTFDLGEAHSQILRLEIALSHEDRLVRRIQLRFGPDEAPRRISRQLTLPSEEMVMEIEVETGAGVVRERREIDLREPGDVTVHVGDLAIQAGREEAGDQR
ncbi:MAG: hypothetical protein ACOC0J_01035 [Myxococcota bacterium]